MRLLSAGADVEEIFGACGALIKKKAKLIIVLVYQPLCAC